MTVNELSRALDVLIPASLSEEWDHDGRMVVPDGNGEVKKAVIALDATEKAIGFAASIGAQAILTHHPLVFHPIDRLDEYDPVAKKAIKCVRNGIAVLSYHTRLDSLEGGVNDCLAAALGLKDTYAFLPFGRLGNIENETPLEDYVAFCEEALGEKCSFAVKGSGKVKRVAIVSGGGKDHLLDACLAGADTFVTGEANHGAYIAAAEYGINLVCMTHHATERVVLPFLAGLVEKASGGTCETVIFDFDRVREYGI
ncbi:MAG: Nif3-like dinuclear metal center hexameric protein [Clostridia bacterium]|nr:Nif3-like dinuclear metal center hexameric protein [Clostridia bacterium]